MPGNSVGSLLLHSPDCNEHTNGEDRGTDIDRYETLGRLVIQTFKFQSILIYNYTRLY